jgi:DNA invertase Pin-like site-specific DNA recombinase
MSTSNGNGKPLRFAALPRVSTEKQERRGESLRTQTEQVTQAVKALGGVLVRTYGGQEHATAGWERKQLEKLLEDARRVPRPWDAVIVADPTRWSRDNVQSETGLDTLRGAGVRFFVLTSEYDLFDPQARLFLGLSSTIGAFQARVQKQKSLLNRIARARRGVPATAPPFGRVWVGGKDEGDGGHWEVIPDKVAKIEDVAKRYLAGESLPRLAEEHDVSRGGLWRLLRDGCGDTWEVSFHAPDLNIDERVTMTVPPLLDEQTIKRVRQRLDANGKHLHRPPVPKHTYLLSGRVFCAACGYSLCGEVVRGRRYYKHFQTARWRRRPCPLQHKPCVRAEALEVPVLRQLFQLVGNPSAIRRAVTAAAPDVSKALAERKRLENELAKVAAGRERLLGLVVKGAVTERQAEKQLAALTGRERELTERLEALAEELAGVPDEAAVEDFTARVEKAGGSILVYNHLGFIEDGGNDVGSWNNRRPEDERALVEAVFSQPCADGKPAGVYVSAAGEHRNFKKTEWTWVIRGVLSFEAILGTLSSGVPSPEGMNA